MISILIIDDSDLKLKVLRSALENITGIDAFDIAHDIIDAKKYLEYNFYDLVILDLNIPKRSGDDPLPNNSVDLLREINIGVRLTKPSYIIGITEYIDLAGKYNVEFEKYLWQLIICEPNTDSIEIKLVDKVNYLIKAKTIMLASSTQGYGCDLLFVTALRKPELEAVLNLPVQWNSYVHPNDSTEFFEGTIKEGHTPITMKAVSSPQMGMVATSVLTTNFIQLYRPKYLVMTGIAAGVKNQSNYGDILIAETVFDYTSGKSSVDDSNSKIFQPDYRYININQDLLHEIQSCIGRRQYLDEIRNKWIGQKPSTSLEIHIGPLASGGSVVADAEIPDRIISHARKLIGIDMETYGLYYAAKNCTKPRPIEVVSIKSVVDFANSSKNDHYHEYASYTSSAFAFQFFKNKIKNDANSEKSFQSLGID